MTHASFGPGGPPDPDIEAIASLFKVMRYTSVMSVEDPVDIATIKVLASMAELGPCRGSDIAPNLHLDLSTVSRHLASLEKQGLLRKTPDPFDGRASLVELTAEGYAVMRKMLENRAAVIAPVLAAWSEDDRSQLFALITRLASELHQESATRRSGHKITLPRIDESNEQVTT